MRLSELVGVLQAELTRGGDIDVVVAVRPAWGFIMPGEPVAFRRGEGALAVVADQVDEIDWVSELDGHGRAL